MSFKPVSPRLTSNPQAVDELVHGDTEESVQVDQGLALFKSLTTEDQSSVSPYSSSSSSPPPPPTSPPPISHAPIAHAPISPPLSAQPSTPPQEYALFDSRVRHVVKHLRGARRCEVWGIIFPHYSDEQIVKFIHDYTVESMKQLINRDELPTFKELQAIPWFDTKDFGVYGKLLESPDQFQGNYVYAGSASSPDNGLRHRQKTHLNDTNKVTTAYKYGILLACILNPSSLT